MKWIFTTFCKAMERLSEKPHAVKCVFIFSCVIMATALGMGIGMLIGTRMALILGGIAGIWVFLNMVWNYNRLWDVVGPSLETSTTPTAQLASEQEQMQPASK